MQIQIWRNFRKLGLEKCSSLTEMIENEREKKNLRLTSRLLIRGG